MRDRKPSRDVTFFFKGPGSALGSGTEKELSCSGEEWVDEGSRGNGQGERGVV